MASPGRAPPRNGAVPVAIRPIAVTDNVAVPVRARTVAARVA